MEFEHVHHLLKGIFASAGTRVLPMSNLDHFKHYKTFLNPSLAERFDFDPTADFQPELSIQENCWHSEGNGQGDFGFYLDGHYHSVIALTRWPRHHLIPASSSASPICGCWTTPSPSMLIRCPLTQEINKE